jgi:hypothetical protein
VQQIRAIEERIGVLENRVPEGVITPSGRGLQGEPGKTGVPIEELGELRSKIESFGKPASLEDFNSLSNNFKSLKTEVEVSEDFNSILKELKDKVDSLSGRSKTSDASEKKGLFSDRLKEMLKPRRTEALKPSPSEDIGADVEELSEKVKSLEKRIGRELGERDLGERIIEEDVV